MLQACEHLLNFIWFEGVVGPNGWSGHNHFFNVLLFVVLVNCNVSEIIVELNNCAYIKTLVHKLLFSVFWFRWIVAVG